MSKFRRFLLLALIGLIIPSCKKGGGSDGGGSPGGGGGIGITPVASPPRFAFIANRAGGSLSIAAVTASNGAWRHLGYVATGTLPSGVAANPAGTFVYAANSGSNNVSGYAVSTAGVLTSVPGSPFATGLTPSSIAIEATGAYCYVADFLSNQISAFAINASGTLVPVPGSPFATGARPISISIEPTGAFLYVANSASDNVSIFHITASTGALTPVTGSPVGTGIAPLAVAVDAGGRRVYVANSGSNSVSAFKIEVSGGLTAIAGSPYAVGTAPSGVSSDALGKFLYVSNGGSNTVSGFSIASNGALTPVAGSPFATAAAPDRVAADPSGTFLYVFSPATNIVSKFTIDPATGVLTASTSERGRTAYAMAISSGTSATFVPKFAYVSNNTDTKAFSINATTGALTTVPGSPFGQGLFLAADPLGRYLYATTAGSSTGIIQSINAGTGALAVVDVFTAGSSPYNLTVDASSRFLFVANGGSGNVSAYTINQSDGRVTAVAGSPFTAGTGAFGITSDPTGRFVYVVNQTANTISGYSINQSSGVLTAISGSPFAWAGTAGGLSRYIVVDPSGRLAYATNINTSEVTIYNIDSATGALNPSGLTLQINFSLSGISIDPLNRFVYSTSNGLYLHVITTPATGALTVHPGSPFAGGTFATMPAVDISGRFVYTANYNVASFSAFSINQTTGVPTEILGSPYTTSTNATGVALTGVVQ